MQTVYRQFKILAQLNFVYQNKIACAWNVTAFDIIVQRVIVFEIFKFRKVEIDMHDIGIRNVACNISLERFQQIWFSATPYAGYYLYDGRTDYVFEFVEIKISFNQFHSVTSQNI